jgi:hypothetical protein
MTTWQAREVTKVWQKAVFEKAGRLVRLHAAIEHVEGRVALPAHTTISIRIASSADTDPLEYKAVEVEVERGDLLMLLREEEKAIITDLARILRQVDQ